MLEVTTKKEKRKRGRERLSPKRDQERPKQLGALLRSAILLVLFADEVSCDADRRPGVKGGGDTAHAEDIRRFYPPRLSSLLGSERFSIHPAGVSAGVRAIRTRNLGLDAI